MTYCSSNSVGVSGGYSQTAGIRPCCHFSLRLQNKCLQRSFYRQCFYGDDSV